MANIDTTKGTTVGTRGNDTITAKADFKQYVFGWKGNDTITGGKGGDYLDGGDGNDTLILQKGSKNAMLNGGNGRDTADLFQYTSGAARSISNFYSPTNQFKNAAALGILIKDIQSFTPGPFLQSATSRLGLSSGRSEQRSLLSGTVTLKRGTVVKFDGNTLKGFESLRLDSSSFMNLVREYQSKVKAQVPGFPNAANFT
ncbi:MAG: hypothetical protein AAF228_12555 [Pseudomonadota bacterium]